MKIILFLFCAVTLLASTGCIYWGGHDRGGDREHHREFGHDEHSSGVDHGEYPGDHRENR